MVRKIARRSRHRRQHGGGFGFSSPAFVATAGMAPLESRTAYDTCAAPERLAPQAGGACKCGKARPPLQQSGGASGSGGYMPILSNDLGKFHAGYLTGECPSARQVGGGEAVAAVSYPTGYGFDASSPYATPSQSAHFLEPRAYGQQCMGGGSRRRYRSRRHRRSQRRRRHTRR